MVLTLSGISGKPFSIFFKAETVFFEALYWGVRWWQISQWCWWTVPRCQRHRRMGLQPWLRVFWRLVDGLLNTKKTPGEPLSAGMIETAWEKVNVMASHSNILHLHCKSTGCLQPCAQWILEGGIGRTCLQGAVETLQGLKQNPSRRETSAL